MTLHDSRSKVSLGQAGGQEADGKKRDKIKGMKIRNERKNKKRVGGSEVTRRGKKGERKIGLRNGGNERKTKQEKKGKKERRRNENEWK